MLQYDFEESIGYWLTIATQAVHRALNDELGPHGITYRQSQVLAWLALEGELTQADLAGRMLIEPPTLVGILDRMERDGWIRRESSPTDRRKKLIRPDPAAEPVWDRVVTCARRVRARAARGLNPEDLERVRTVLAAIQANLKSP